MNRLTKTVQLEDTGDAKLPWKATVDGELWQIRMNEFPGSKHLWALLVDGKVTDEFSQWPAGFTKPVDEYEKREYDNEVARADREYKAANPPKSTDDLFAAADAEDAEDLAAAEREASKTGKEPFSLARLEQLLGKAPGSQADYEASWRNKYYIRYPAMKTLTELADLLRELEVWQ
jgi:hypothetical protein